MDVNFYFFFNKYLMSVYDKVGIIENIWEVYRDIVVFNCRGIDRVINKCGIFLSGVYRIVGWVFKGSSNNLFM